MENKMNKFGLERQLTVLAVAFACVCMWGCSDDVEFRWEESRRDAKIIGFVNDSLVMVGDYRFWHKSTEQWNGAYYEDSDAGNPRLCVYNYRVQEDGPRWCDSLEEMESSNRFGGQLTDSIVWGGYWGTQKNWRGEYLTLWKIGGKPRKVDLKLVFEGCSKEIGINRMHEWFDGKFIALGVTTINSKTFGNALRASDYGDEYCQYAILDTVTKTITYKRLDKNLDWIELCDDVRAWNDDVYCLVLKDEPLNLYFVKTNVYLDTLLQGAPYGWAKNTSVGFAGDMLNLGNNICEIINDKFVCLGVSVRDALEYRQKNGISIVY